VHFRKHAVIVESLPGNPFYNAWKLTRRVPALFSQVMSIKTQRRLLASSPPRRRAGQSPPGDRCAGQWSPPPGAHGPTAITSRWPCFNSADGFQQLNGPFLFLASLFHGKFKCVLDGEFIMSGFVASLVSEARSVIVYLDPMTRTIECLRITFLSRSWRFKLLLGLIEFKFGYAAPFLKIRFSFLGFFIKSSLRLVKKQ